MGYQQFPFEVKSSWFTGACNITTYKLEELLGTKLRALYQRSKGRDLYDLHKAFVLTPELNKEEILKSYHRYMEFVVEPPTQKLFIQNIEKKLLDDEFLGDIKALLRPTEKYDQTSAFALVKTELLQKLNEGNKKS